VVDWTACAALFLLVSIPAGMVQIVGSTVVADGTLRGAIGVLSQLAVAAAAIAYLTLGLRSGQTLGLRAVDVHVRVAETGLPPGLARSLGRGVLAVVFALALLDADVALRGRPPLGGFSELEQTVLDVAVVVALVAVLGKLWAFVDPARQSVWDRAFGLLFLEDLDARDTAEVDYGSWLRRRTRAPS
jgi:RDD family